MKKLAAMLAAAMLLSMMSVPTMAAADRPSQELVIPTYTEANMPDPNDPASPDVIEIIEEETPLGEAEDVLPEAETEEPITQEEEPAEEAETPQETDAAQVEETAVPEEETPASEEETAASQEETAAPEEEPQPQEEQAEAQPTQGEATQEPERHYYVKVQNDEGDYEYIPEEEVPQGLLPEFFTQPPVDLRDIGEDALKATDIKTDGQMSTAVISGSFISNADGTVKVNQEGQVEVDARSGKNVAISGVTLTVEATETLLEAETEVVIHMDVGSFALDTTLLESIQAAGSNAMLQVNKQSEEITATAEMPADSQVYSYYELKLVDEDGNSIPFQGGVMTITLPYAFPSGYAGVVVNGKIIEEHELTVNPDGTASFQVEHLSTWALYTMSALGYTAPSVTRTYNWTWLIALMGLLLGFVLGCVVSPRRRSKRKKA